MSHMKNLHIDALNAKPEYEVSVMGPDGPDDFQYEVVYSTPEYMDCIKYATELHEKGAKVKIFDPFVGNEYHFPKDF